MAKRNRKNRPISLLDIIIPVYSKIDFLEKCLDCLSSAAGDIAYHVYIHDNGTPVEEKSFYKTLDDDRTITVMQTKRPLGFPVACNLAAKRGNSSLILFLNSDCFLEPNAIVEMVKEMDNPQTGVVGAKLLFPEDTPNGPAGMVQHVGIELNIRAEVYHQFIGWTPDNPKVLAKHNAMAVTGAALMTRRNLWRKIGGFFEGYGAGCLSWRYLCLYRQRH